MRNIKYIVVVLSLIFLKMSMTLNAQITPDFFNGEWEGIGVQSSPQSEWQTNLYKFPGNDTIRVVYPSLNCSGTWKIASTKGSSVLIERIDNNPSMNCVAFNWVYITIIDPDTVRAEFAFKESPKWIVATLILHKIPRA